VRVVVPVIERTRSTKKIDKSTVVLVEKERSFGSRENYGKRSGILPNLGLKLLKNMHSEPSRLAAFIPHFLEGCLRVMDIVAIAISG